MSNLKETTNTIIEKVVGTIRAHDLLNPGQAVLIALSGGPDSTALLRVLGTLRRRLNISLGAVYIDHNLRPRAVKKEIAFCQDLCRRHKVEFYLRRADIPMLAKRERCGLEETARRYRYQILQELAEECGYDRIALGHHRDDQAETVLFNLIRGSGPSGAAGMAPRRHNIIRPLFDLRRTEIEDYLKAIGQECMTDSSNRDRTFTRNRIRHWVLPVIEKEISPAVAETLARHAEIVREEDRFLGTLVNELESESLSMTPGGKIRLDLSRFGAYDESLKRRLIQRVLRRLELFDSTFADIDRILDLVRYGRKTKVTIRENRFAELSSGGLFLYAKTRPALHGQLPIPGTCRLAYPRLEVSARVLQRKRLGSAVPSAENAAYVDRDKIGTVLVIDRIKNGQRFHPFRRPGRKKIGDFLTDVKFPRPLRDEVPVLYDTAGVVWISGVEIDNRVAVTESTREVVRLAIRHYADKSATV